MEQIKRKTLRLIVLINIITLGVIISGCDNQLDFLFNNEDIIEFQETPNNNTDIIKLSYDTWQDQLDYLIDDRPETSFITKQGLKLISYKLLPDDEDANGNINARSYFPLYNNPMDYNKYEILPLSEISKSKPNIVNDYIHFRESVIDQHTNTSLRKVQLKWAYKNVEFTTLCLVVDSEIIYDDLLSHIYVITISEPSETRQIPRLKSGNENDGPIIYFFNSPSCSISGLTGSAVAWASVTVYGTRAGSINSITGYTPEYYSSTTGFGYVADAYLNILGYESGANGYCRFKWEVSVAQINPSGGSKKFGAETNITPNMLSN